MIEFVDWRFLRFDQCTRHSSNKSIETRIQNFIPCLEHLLKECITIRPILQILNLGVGGTLLAPFGRRMSGYDVGYSTILFFFTNRYFNYECF